LEGCCSTTELYPPDAGATATRLDAPPGSRQLLRRRGPADTHLAPGNLLRLADISAFPIFLLPIAGDAADV